MQNRLVCLLVFSLLAATSSMRGQDAVKSKSEGAAESLRVDANGTQLSPQATETEVEPIVISATRFEIPLDQSPASVSVITSQDLEAKQIERISDACTQ